VAFNFGLLTAFVRRSQLQTEQKRGKQISGAGEGNSAAGAAAIVKMMTAITATMNLLARQRGNLSQFILAT
jgi:mevalonate pyrophosphate decarboxylase